MTDPRIDAIQARLTDLRRELLTHPLYERLSSIAALRRFMQQHVFAVWDFMSLLKVLQQRLCCNSVPWLPPENRLAARLINEIVLGEESDADGAGGHASHFELYHAAMVQCGAEVRPIDELVERLRAGEELATALHSAEVPSAAAQFVRHTFSVIATGDLPAVAAAFTFGREDLLPDVFQRIVDELDAELGGGLAQFRYYLHRHIDLDGDEHGPAAMKLVSTLCGNDPACWARAGDAAVAALTARKALWDGMLADFPAPAVQV